MCTNIFTKKEVQTILKVSSFMVDKLINENKIEHFYVGKRVRVTEDQLNQYIEENKTLDCISKVREENQAQMTAN